MSRAPVLAVLVLLTGSAAAGANAESGRAADDERLGKACYEYRDDTKIWFPNADAFLNTPPEALSWLYRPTEPARGIFGYLQNFLDQLPALQFRSFAAPNYSY